MRAPIEKPRDWMRGIFVAEIVKEEISVHGELKKEPEIHTNDNHPLWLTTSSFEKRFTWQYHRRNCDYHLKNFTPILPRNKVCSVEFLMHSLLLFKCIRNLQRTLNIEIIFWGTDVKKFFLIAEKSWIFLKNEY